MTRTGALVALCALAATTALAGKAMAEEQARVVTVSGSGEVRAAPDKAVVSMSAEARMPTQNAAKSHVNDAIENFLGVARRLGIRDRHIKTFGLQVRPEYDWNSKTRERRLLGYFVSRSIQVDLDDLSKLGELLENATDAGVTNVSPPVLESSRKVELSREALAKAAEDARANAEVLAKTLDARVGDVRRVSTADVAYVPPRPQMMEMTRGVASAKSAAESYETGEILFTARVNAEFDLVVD